MKEKNSIGLLVMGIATLLVAIVGAAYAYFSSSITPGSGLNLDVEAQANTAQFTASGGEFGFVVTGAEMQQANAGSLAKEATGTLDVTLTATQDSLCTFDVAFAWNAGSSYTPTKTLGENEIEFGAVLVGDNIGGFSNISKLTNFDKITGDYNGLLIEDAKIVIRNIQSETTKTESISFKVQMYNLNHDQSALAGTGNKTYSGRFYVTNVECIEVNLPLKDVILASNDVYSDAIASTYVTSSTGINFANVASNTNGNGLYVTNKNTEGNEPTYYFRGNIQNNYVKFGKVNPVYEEGPDVYDPPCSYKGLSVYAEGEEPNCSEITTVCRMINIGYNEGEMLKSNMYYPSSSISSCASANAELVGYWTNNAPDQSEINPDYGVCLSGDTGQIMPKLSWVNGVNSQGGVKIDFTVSSQDCQNMSVYLFDHESSEISSGYFLANQDVADYYFGDYDHTVSSISRTYSNEKLYETNAKVVNKNEDPLIGQSWDSINWRIVRINEDGSIRLMYNGRGNIFNVAPYMWDFAWGPNRGPEYSETSAKEYVDDWFLVRTNLNFYANSHLADAGFCNDTTIGSRIDNGGDPDEIIYSGAMRFNNPQYKCNNATENLYTLSNSSKGNSRLTYPVGLLTSDEWSYAGRGMPGIEENILSMTPSGQYGEEPIRIVSLNNSGFGAESAENGGTMYPVINLKSTVKIASGDGTISNPYIIQVD